MTFTDISILAGLAALAIPVLVHLYGRRRARRVVLPTARFAQGAHLATVGRRRLERGALLALRLAAVALLVLAVAGPRVGGTAGAGPAGVWAVCLDSSPSMAAEDDGATRYGRAKEAAERLLASLASGDNVIFVAGGQPVRRGSPGQMRAALEAEAPQAGRAEPIGSLVSRADAALAQAPSPGAPAAHLVVLTDATPWALRDLGPGQFADLEAEAVLVPIGGEVRNGWLGLPKTQVLDTPEGRRLVVEVDAAAPPGAPGRAAAVHLALDLSGEAQTAEARPGDGRARFVLAVEGDGPWQGRVWMDGPDALAADDERFFTAVGPAVVQVLVVDASGQREGVRSADLVRAAFAGQDPAEPKEARGVAADALTDRDLASADVVFWVGPHEAGRAASLTKYVEGGGAVVWIPAEAAAPDPRLEDLLGVRVGGVETIAEGVTMDPAGYVSSLLAALEGGTAADLGRPVLRRRLVVEAEASAAAVRFVDGRCAMADRRLGRGRAVTLAVGPAPEWGDLSSRPEFVVLAHSLVEATAAGAHRREANRVVGRADDEAENLRPGHFPAAEAAGSAGWKGPFSVNLAPEETQDLGPQPERLVSAFSAERSHVASAAEAADEVASASGSRGDAAAWFVVPLLAAVLVETYLSGRSSGRAENPPQTA